MTPKFKFLRRVRIHGGECGAVARALHHEAQKVALTQNEQTLISDECVLLSQAELEKSSNSTLNERKQMSTKTSIKRIALVAVSALGFGVLSSVSAFAVDAADSEISAVALATPGTGRIGSAFTTQVSITSANVVEAADEIVLRARFEAKPAGSTATLAFNDTGLALKLADGSDVSGETGTYTAENGTGNALLPARYVVVDANEALGNQAHVVGRVGFLPDVVGTYTVTVWHDADRDGLIDTGESKSTATDYVVGNAPASVKVTKLSGIGVVGADALVKLELLDSAGAAAGLAANESLTLTSSVADVDFTFINGVASGIADNTAATLTASSFVKGVSYIGFNGDSAATPTITIAGVGGSVSSLSGTFTQQFVAQAAPTTGATVLMSSSTTAATYGVASNAGVAGTLAATTFPIATKTLTYGVTVSAGIAAAATDQYVGAAITDVGGYVTGAIAQGITTDLVYTTAVALTAATVTATIYTGSFSVKVTSPTIAENQYSLVVNDDNDNADGADDTAAAGATALVSINALASAVSVSPSAALSLKTGSSITYSATVVDQFGRALPNASVAMSGGTRNAIVILPTAITDANGKATFTVTDAPAAGVTSLTDTFSFTASYAGAASNATSAGAITWSATGPVVGTVTVTTGTEDDTASSITYRDIAAGATGAQAGAASITITVKDASGNLLAGVPVTVTTASAGTAVLSTSATVYTGAAGTATASVYGWTEGKKTFTATAGGVSASGTVNYKQQTATEVRTISAAISGQIVTVTAKDRFGNTVEGVTIYGTRTGTGFFGNGASSSSAATDKTGVAEFVVNGTGTFKFAAGSATAADLEYGQTASTSGKVGTTAVTAYVAGTSSVAEKGVGDTFAAAGVNSASLAVAVVDSAAAAADAAAGAADAATDAALEAIDAANAATDAANLAAEAADAATVAAEEARDAADAATAAVEELATQVATLMAALKAQITTLANTVAKIAKKVKA